MVTHLPDTNIIIHVLRNQKQRTALLERLLEQGHLLACCSVTVAEVYAGMHPREEAATRELMSSMLFLPATVEIAQQAGLLKRDFAKKGSTLSVADTLIASVAMANACSLITENAKDFPMPGVRLYPLE